MTGTVDLTTMIAELEEAERAATPGPWKVSPANNKYVEGGKPSEHNGFKVLVSDSFTGADDGSEEANARLIALMRTHLPVLVEAVKRQREALNHIVSIGEAHGSNYDFERILDMRDAARTALGDEQ